MTIIILQINLHRSVTASHLKQQMAYERKADIMLISEQYDNPGNQEWMTDTLGTAAIWVVNRSKVPVEASGAGAGYVWMRSRGVTYFSCYFTPNEPIADYEEKLNHLEDELRRLNGKLLVAGDFNARGTEWGMPIPDSRGRRLADMQARLGLIVMNQGNIPTFRRAGHTGSIPDVTMASEALAAITEGWQVLEDFSGSDHQYIQYGIGGGARQRRPPPPPRWNVERLDGDLFETMITIGKGTLSRVKQQAVSQSTIGTRVGSIAISLVIATMGLLTRACECSMPRKTTVRDRRPVYWWSQEIAELRKSCFKLRRLAQRAQRNTPNFQLKSGQYRAARRALKSAIAKSKIRKWNELCEDVESDPWGLGYKLVLQKLGGADPTSELPTDVKERIVEELFPLHEPEERATVEVIPTEIPLFTRDELQKAAKTMRNRKAPGPDGIPVEILKMVSERHPDVLLNMYNECLMEGQFPEQWKTARLALIGKGKGDPNTASAYRPLCMLDTAGKLYEKLLKQRMLDAIAMAGGLSPRQYGFTAGKSTIDAINEVVTVANSVQAGNHWSREMCLAVTLDVKNAFNSVRWKDILTALKDRFQVPPYLFRVLQDYLADRWVTYETQDGQKKMRVTSGAAQGSVLGADIWNLNYDGVLRISMPQEGITLVGYADDLILIITGRTVDQLQYKLNQAMRRVIEWLQDHALSLAVHKTEMVLLTTKRVERCIPMYVGDQTIETARSLRYLGVMMDSKLCFWDHICRVSDKAAKVVGMLSKLMANVGGPSPAKRRLLMSTTDAIMLYGAEIWADSLKYMKYRVRMEAVQRRGALRVCSAFRTVSGPATQVVSGVIPIHLLAAERRRIYLRKDEGQIQVTRKEEREETHRRWIQLWSTETRGRWTARLITDIRKWQERNHGEVNYYLTQFLTGHGYFRTFLVKIGKLGSPICRYCGAEDDDAHHTFFTCTKWSTPRGEVSTNLGSLTPETVIAKMLEKIENWDIVANFVFTVLKTKETNREWEED